MKYKFKSKRVKMLDPDFRRPDYHNIIDLNGTLFTLTGWMNGASSDIDYTLERVTEERLKSNKFLRKEFIDFNRGGKT